MGNYGKTAQRTHTTSRVFAGMICGILASDVASQGMHTPKYPTRGSTVSLQSENVKYETKNSKGKSHPVYTPKSDTHSGEQYDSTDFEFFEDSNECSCYGRISEIPDEEPMQKFFKCDGEGFQPITGSSIYSVYYELNGDFTQHDADMYQQSSLQEYFEINEEGTLYAYRQDPYISVSVPDSDPKSHVSCTTEIESGDVWFALSLSLLAGLANAVGGIPVFFLQATQDESGGMNPKYLTTALGVSAGVILFISLVEIFTEAQLYFRSAGFEERRANLLTTLWFSFGFLLLLVIDKITDLMWDDSAEEEKPVVKLDPPSATSTTTEACSHDVVEASKPFQSSSAQPTKAEILKMGCKTVLAICLHNLPEGAATYIGAVADRSFGITLALAIGLHNIPEGLSVAMPVYYATGSRWKGFLAAFFSGVPNPVGALVCYYCFSQTDHLIFAACFGAVAGLMVGIAVQQILPVARRMDPDDHYVSYSTIAGILAMAFAMVFCS